MTDIYYTPVETNWGIYMIASTNKGVCQIHYLQNDEFRFFTWLEKKLGQRGKLSWDKNKEAAQELKEFLVGKRTKFESPLDLIGTPFQIKVWEQLRTIPYGETVCYSDIAKLINLPKGARAVGMANNANPILLMVPCHRVIGKNGSLVGFGCGLDLKHKLLTFEENNKNKFNK